MEAYPKKILAALIKIASEVPNLEKDNENKYGKYSYVSIDDYYAKVAKIANGHGISWILKERACQVSRGDDGNHIHFTYSFDVYSSDGECIRDFTSLSVIHPIQGAQSSGSAASYAEKMFMRTVFKVRTGEPDADASDPNALEVVKKKPSPKQPAPTPGPKPPLNLGPTKSSEPTTSPLNREATGAELQNEYQKEAEALVSYDVDETAIIGKVPDIKSDHAVGIIVEAARIFGPMCDSTGQLKKFKDVNKARWNEVKERDPAAYLEIVGILTETYKKLEKDEK